MIKLSFALKRRPELTRGAFQAYWFDTHAPLVASVREALRIRRYVQSHSLPPEASRALRDSRGGPEDFDGLAELWWDSLDDMAGALGAPEGQAAAARLLEDERRFIDLPRSPLWWSHERVIF
jgi:uncharacterized protein (TIGR02118 family)